MAGATSANPNLTSSIEPIVPGYDPVGHQTSVAVKVVNIQTDTSVSPNVVYGDLAISGSISATNPSVSTDGAAIPTSSTLVGASDGTNLQPLQVDGSKNLKVVVQNANTNGQATMANSAPVVIASDQSNLPTNLKQVNGSTLALGQTTMANSLPVAIASNQGAIGSVVAQTATLFTAAQSTVGSGNSGDLDVSKLREISIDITTTAQAGTNPTIQFFWERKGADGNYYPLWQSASLTAASNTLSTSVGAGMAYNQSLGPTGRLRWTVGGSASPNWSFSPNVYGK